MFLQEFFKSTVGKSYKIASVDINSSGPNQWLLPTSAQFTFVYQASGDSIIAALMATRDKPVPSEADRYSFNASELMPSGLLGGSVLHVHNYIFTKLLMENLKNNSDFSDANFIITGDSPSTLSTTNTFGFHGCDLKKFSLTAKNGCLQIAVSLHKGDVSPGISVDIDLNVEVTAAVDKEGTLQLHPGNVNVHKHIHEAWWVTLIGVLVPIAAIVTAIVEAIVKNNIPDIGKMLSDKISDIKVPIQFSSLKIDNFVTGAAIGEYGSLELGLKTSILS